MINTNNTLKSQPYSIGFSLVGSLITILFFAFINISTGGSFPWFIFPSLAIICWPITLLIGSKRNKLLSIVGSIALITSLIIVNYLTTPTYIWFYYPLFLILWWPLSVFFARQNTFKLYSVIGALFIISFLTLDNIFNSPYIPWALLTYFPILMWPVGVLLRRHLGKLGTAMFICLTGIIYYAILNLYVFIGFPWVIFPAYALLWWPLAVAFAKRGSLLIFSVTGSLLSAALFIAVNFFTTPHSIWAVYPIFALIWWPLSTYYFVYLKKKVDVVKHIS